MKIEYTAYKKKYRDVCWNMMVSTWRYDHYFPSIKNTNHLYKLVFDMYRLHSDYLDLAFVISNDAPPKAEPVGFLFGETKDPSGIKKIESILFYTKITLLWIFGYYGDKKTTFDVFKNYSTDIDLLRSGCKSSDAHIHSFFTSDAARGHGLGKLLLNRFTEHCQNNKNNRILLITDTDCNYGFYDHCGFERIKEKKGCLGVPQTDEVESNSRIFVYAKKI